MRRRGVFRRPGRKREDLPWKPLPAGATPSAHTSGSWPPPVPTERKRENFCATAPSSFRRRRFGTPRFPRCCTPRGPGFRSSPPESGRRGSARVSCALSALWRPPRAWCSPAPRPASVRRSGWRRRGGSWCWTASRTPATWGPSFGRRTPSGGRCSSCPAVPTCITPRPSGRGWGCISARRSTGEPCRS